MTKKKTKSTTRDRASRVVDAWENFQGKNSKGEFRFSLGGVETRITRIELGSDETQNWVDVYTGGKKPSVRICNPPLYVRDPNGTVEVSEPDGRGGSVIRMYREDPVAAVATIVAQTRKRK